ncbi:MAG: hypothetical protein HBSAPP03_27680 [Phycisphaerae bacterium]|nr:MAG: hypothetical protein HBSAPP03_27680 [Phycisphaerae bacterium]
MGLPRLRSVMGGKKLPDWAWALIGTGIMLGGAVLLLGVVGLMIGWISPSALPVHRKDRVLGPIILLLGGPALLHMGGVEVVDAIARMRSRRGG